MGTRTKGPKLYTTGKKPQEFVNEILELLQEFEVTSFHVEQEGGQPSAVAFVVETPRGHIPFRLRPNFRGIKARLVEAGVEERAKHGPRAVAWGQIRHLIELQLEAVESDLVTLAEAFGGWALTSGGRTVAEMIEERTGELLPGETPLLTANTADQ